MANELTTGEAVTLESLEAELKSAINAASEWVDDVTAYAKEHKGATSAFAVGKALYDIHSNDLFRVRGTWKEYLLSKVDEWGISYARAVQLTTSYRSFLAVTDGKSDVLILDSGDTKPVPIPDTEASVRPLAGLTDEQKSDVWKEASTNADEEGRTPNATDVKEARESLYPDASTDRFVNFYINGNTSDQSKGNVIKVKSSKVAHIIQSRGDLITRMVTLGYWEVDSNDGFSEVTKEEEGDD